MSIFSCARASMKAEPTRHFHLTASNGEDIRLDHPKIFRDVREIGPCDRRHCRTEDNLEQLAGEIGFLPSSTKRPCC